MQIKKKTLQHTFLPMFPPPNVFVHNCYQWFTEPAAARRLLHVLVLNVQLATERNNFSDSSPLETIPI